MWTKKIIRTPQRHIFYWSLTPSALKYFSRYEYVSDFSESAEASEDKNKEPPGGNMLAYSPAFWNFNLLTGWRNRGDGSTRPFHLMSLSAHLSHPSVHHHLYLDQYRLSVSSKQSISRSLQFVRLSNANHLSSSCNLHLRQFTSSFPSMHPVFLHFNQSVRRQRIAVE